MALPKRLFGRISDKKYLNALQPVEGFHRLLGLKIFLIYFFRQSQSVKPNSGRAYSVLQFIP
jgi:hypothetical protein